MTMPPEPITVACPACGELFETWHRPSMNLDLDDFSDEYVEEMSTATCPACGQKFDLGSLIVEDGVLIFGEGEDDEGGEASGTDDQAGES